LFGLAIHSISQVIDRPFVAVERELDQLVSRRIEACIDVLVRSPCERAFNGLLPPFRPNGVLIADRRASSHVASTPKRLFHVEHNQFSNSIASSSSSIKRCSSSSHILSSTITDFSR